MKRPGFRHFPCPRMVVIDLKWVLRLDAHVGGQVAVLFEAPFQRFDRWSTGIVLVNRDHHDMSSSKVIIHLTAVPAATETLSLVLSLRIAYEESDKKPTLLGSPSGSSTSNLHAFSLFNSKLSKAKQLGGFWI